MQYFVFCALFVGIFLNVAYWTNAQGNFMSIVCHQCTPLFQSANCAELQTNDTLVTCTNWGISDVTVSCFSGYMNFNYYANIPGGSSEETGIYRGCAQRQENITDFCGFYRELLLDINVTLISCATCKEDECNTHRFTADGQLAGSAMARSFSMFVLVAAIFGNALIY